MSLYVMEKSHVNLIIVLLLAATNIGLDFILIPRYGVVGAIVPVALVIAVSPLLYKAALARFLTGARIPFRFIGKCFAASSPVLLLLPLVTRVQNIFQLSAVAAAGALLLVLSFKRFGVLGTDEMRLLEGIPGAVRILRFIAPREARAGGEEIRPDGEGK
jgi:O-antigen/teichoic acid export membrane protein